jgi:hypothetical protein
MHRSSGTSHDDRDQSLPYKNRVLQSLRSCFQQTAGALWAHCRPTSALAGSTHAQREHAAHTPFQSKGYTDKVVVWSAVSTDLRPKHSGQRAALQDSHMPPHGVTTQMWMRHVEVSGRSVWFSKPGFQPTLCYHTTKHSSTSTPHQHNVCHATQPTGKSRGCQGCLRPNKHMHLDRMTNPVSKRVSHAPRAAHMTSPDLHMAAWDQQSSKLNQRPYSHEKMSAVAHNYILTAEPDAPSAPKAHTDMQWRTHKGTNTAPCRTHVLANIATVTTGKQHTEAPHAHAC